MPIKCPSGTKVAFRFKKGTNIRLGGCMKGEKFITDGIKEIKKIIKNGQKN